MSVEKTVKLLWDLGSSLEPTNHVQRLLKSYYINTSRKISKYNLQMPNDKFATSKMCQSCLSHWEDNEFSLNLRPSRLFKNSKCKNIITKLEQSVLQTDQSDSKHMTQAQKRRAKWLKKRISSNVQIVCNVCQRKSAVPLEKSLKSISNIRKTKDNFLITNIDEPQTAKKKHKNKSAGLKLANMISNKTPRKKSKNPLKATSQNSNSSDKKPFTKVQNQEHQQQKPSQKPKNKKKQSQQTMPKVVSKTQQQNSLLQLAALLNKQRKKSSNTNTAQGRLEALLK